MGITTEYSIIIGYLIFIGFLGFILTIGGPQIIENAPPTPIFPTAAPGILDYLTFAFYNLGYFFLIMAIASVTYPWLGVFIIAMSITFLYMILRLIRGGG